MKKAFSLIELLISLIIISLIISTFMPVISKRIKNSSVSLSSSEQITTDCQNSPNYGDKCELCTKKYCIKCGITNCQSGEYVNTKKCNCENCTDYDPKCIECNNQGCTKCAAKHYIKNGKCEPCPSSSYCDGANIYASCPGAGYYCDDEGIHKCFDKHGSLCTLCTKNACTGCTGGYFAQGGVCKPCGTGCGNCTSATYCLGCWSGYYLKNHTCIAGCTSNMPGCYRCTDAYVCTQCHGGYYLNSAKSCTKCSLSNCQKCADNRPASSPICEACFGGNYLSGGSCVSCKKYDANCAVCDKEKCLSCNSGFHLDENNKCKDNDLKFGCSDSNFMQIGNLCITRKNMGDSYTLPIPETVTIAQAGSEYCYSTNQKCCWKGRTSNSCSDKFGYSGCTRTVCNFEAASEICRNFNYQGKKWRLATRSEMASWGQYSMGLGAQGLMLCDHTSGYQDSQCAVWSVSCLGGLQNGCWIFYIWSATETDTLHAYTFGTYFGEYSIALEPKTMAASVRCVSEME